MKIVEKKIFEKILDEELINETNEVKAEVIV